MEVRNLATAFISKNSGHRFNSCIVNQIQNLETIESKHTVELKYSILQYFNEIDLKLYIFDK